MADEDVRQVFARSLLFMPEVSIGTAHQRSARAGRAGPGLEITVFKRAGPEIRGKSPVSKS